jgi:hypothetical protein
MSECRSGNISQNKEWPMVSTEVSRGRSKPATSSVEYGEVSQKEEGPNVRMAKGTKRL